MALAATVLMADADKAKNVLGCEMSAWIVTVYMDVGCVTTPFSKIRRLVGSVMSKTVKSEFRKPENGKVHVPG